jgi:hypothetical protein
MDCPVLREGYDDVSDTALDELVSWSLEILAKVVRSQMNCAARRTEHAGMAGMT